MNPKTKTFIILFLSFLLGCIVGMSLLSDTWRSLTRRTSHRGGYKTYLYERLSLDSTQIVRVDSLLDEYRASINTYRSALNESRDSLRTEIRSLLRESQQAEYDRMIRDMDRRQNHRRADSSSAKNGSP